MRVKNKRGILLWMDRKYVLGGSTGGSWNVRYGSGACLEFCSWVVKWERRGDAVQSLRLPGALYRNLNPRYSTAIAHIVMNFAVKINTTVRSSS
jgi:hypothetical protein